MIKVDDEQGNNETCKDQGKNSSPIYSEDVGVLGCVLRMYPSQFIVYQQGKQSILGQLDQEQKPEITRKISITSTGRKL